MMLDYDGLYWVGTIHRFGYCLKYALNDNYTQIRHLNTSLSEGLICLKTVSQKKSFTTLRTPSSYRY